MNEIEIIYRLFYFRLSDLRPGISDARSPDRASSRFEPSPTRLESRLDARIAADPSPRLPSMQLDPPPEFGGGGRGSELSGHQSGESRVASSAAGGKRWGLAEFPSPVTSPANDIPSYPNR